MAETARQNRHAYAVNQLSDFAKGLHPLMLRTKRSDVNAKCVTPSAKLAGMDISDFKDRLRAARVEAKFPNATAAARGFGWPVSTYLGYENGDREPSKAMARRIADAYRVSLEWLLTGRGEMKPIASAFRVVVMGKIGAGAAILPEMEQVPDSGLYEVSTPFSVPKGAIAFEVEGDSMWPRYDPGDVIVCWRQGSNTEEVIGWEAAVRTADGHRYLKRVLKGADPGTFDLESHNAPPIRGVKIEWIAQVHAVVRADMWKLATPRQRREIERHLVRGTSNR